MKKLLVFILCFALVFSLSACNIEIKNAESTESSTSQLTSTNSVVSRENKSNNVSEKVSSTSPQSNKTNTNSTKQTTQSTSSQEKIETSSKSPLTSDSATSSNIDNGVLKKAISEKISVPQNMELLGTDSAKEEDNSKNTSATAVAYQLDGNVVNWTTENDFIYIITEGNNRLVVINSKTMAPVSNVPLSGKPAEINIVGDKIYISIPDLCRIDIFSKSSVNKLSSLYFEHEISSFCIDGNYIYYSEHDQHCEVYKKNMSTNELTRISANGGGFFYQPKLYLNKQDNILYIGETGSTGSTLYYYDATTLQLKSMFRKNNYGIMNHTRDIFHVGNEVYWGSYCISDTNAKEIVGKYGVANYGSVTFASEELVSTFEGIFLADTYECVVNYFDAGFNFEYLLVTKSYNFFFRARSVDKNIIIGVNFNMQ